MTSLLENISSPKDLKILNFKQLEDLAEEIRELLKITISKTGGHFASNLGTVELTIALHYHLNSPKDKIIWDVGHQAYTHKILTGRKDQLNTIRKFDGLSGFLKRAESKHDIIEAGHTSTSISSALGLASARNKKGNIERIYSIIGDGAITAGMAFEALNHTGDLRENINVVLNDNEMSISYNVGALSRYLTKIKSYPSLDKLKEDIELLIKEIPKLETDMSESIGRVKKGLKNYLINGIFFEKLGFTYLGPIDGHKIETLVDNFIKADKIDGPVLIHVNTKKGKGYKFAEERPSKYHGVSPFYLENGENKYSKSKKTYSQVFGETALKIREKFGKEIVAITAAMSSGTGLDIFKEKYPDEFYDVGIAEQHAITLSAGMARGGLKPLVAIYSTFLQRAFDQIIEDIALQNLPVSLFLDRAGLVGNDGETHHGQFDLSYLRIIPNMVIMAPRDENMLQHMILTSVKSNNPTAVRYPRGVGVGVQLDKKLREIEIGTAESLTNNGDFLIISIGSMVNPSIEAAKIIKSKGIEAEIIDARFIKPIDKKLFEKKLKKYKKVVTIEDNVLEGGFGSKINDFILEKSIENIKVKNIGIPDEFITHGTIKQLRKMLNLDAKGIANIIYDFLQN